MPPPYLPARPESRPACTDGGPVPIDGIPSRFRKVPTQRWGDGTRPTSSVTRPVQWETAIRFGCNAARFGIATSSTPCLPLAEMASASAVSGRVNRR